MGDLSNDGFFEEVCIAMEVAKSTGTPFATRYIRAEITGVTLNRIRDRAHELGGVVDFPILDGQKHLKITF